MQPASSNGFFAPHRPITSTDAKRAEGAELIDSVLDVVRKEAEGGRSHTTTSGCRLVEVSGARPFYLQVRVLSDSSAHREPQPRECRRFVQAATASRAFSSATRSVAAPALAWALCSSPRREQGQEWGQGKVCKILKVFRMYLAIKVLPKVQSALLSSLKTLLKHPVEAKGANKNVVAIAN